MTYVRVDDQFTEHPKVLEIGPLAEALWLRGLLYASRNLTDGLVPMAYLRRMGDIDAMELANVLVQAGLWHESEGGYRVHDYEDWQRSKEEVVAISRVRAEAGRLGGLQRASNIANAKQVASELRSKPQAYTETETEQRQTQSRAEAERRADEPRQTRAKTTVIADDWQPTEELRAYAVEWGIGAAFVDEVAREFVTYWRETKGRKANWDMTFQNRVRDVASQYQRRARASLNGRAAGGARSFSELAKEKQQHGYGRGGDGAGHDSRPLLADDQERRSGSAIDAGDVERDAGHGAIETTFRERSALVVPQRTVAAPSVRPAETDERVPP